MEISSKGHHHWQMVGTLTFQSLSMLDIMATWSLLTMLEKIGTVIAYSISAQQSLCLTPHVPCELVRG